MPFAMDRHADDEHLEQYSMGSLCTEESEELEEHLLVCYSCQDRLKDMDNWTEAMRMAACRVRAKARREPLWGRFMPRIPAWAFGFATAALMALIVVTGVQWRFMPRSAGQPLTLYLQATRGLAAENRAPHGRPLILRLSVAEAPVSESYKLEVVDAAGRALWWSSGAPRDGAISLNVGTKLQPGEYYVRLYAASGELLKEFALQVE